MPKWNKIGQGSYNVAYVDENRQRVLKIQQFKGDALDSPERSVRVWNEVNPHIPPPACLSSTNLGNGWICPYVEGKQSTDEEMARGLIEIYNRTGRVIADATAKENFITTPQGQVVCIDIGMALRLQKAENSSPDKIILARQESTTSLTTWSPSLQNNFTPFFEACSKINPKSVETVKALLFIQVNRPDIFDVEFLQDGQQLTAKLAIAYDSQQKQQNLNSISHELSLLDSAHSSHSARKLSSASAEQHIKFATESLRNTRPINFENIQESCIAHIDRYIKSRGTITIRGKFDPSFITKYFRNQRSVIEKVVKMQKLKESINQANSYDDIKKAMNQLIKEDKTPAYVFASGLITALNRCLSCIAIAEKETPDLQSEPQSYRSTQREA